MDENWRDEALCKDLTAQQSDELFFIGPGKSSKRARLFCKKCPVKRDCNDFAVMYNEVGIWAGSTDEDRRNLDPFVADILRAQAELRGHLESRNLNDFIPQVRHQYQTDQIRQEIEDARVQALAEEAALEERLEREAEREAARLVAQDLQYEVSIVLRVNEH